MYDAVVVQGHCAPPPLRHQKLVPSGVDQPPSPVFAIVVQSHLHGLQRDVQVKVDELAVRLAPPQDYLIVVFSEDGLHLQYHLLAGQPGKFGADQSDLQITKFLFESFSFFSSLSVPFISKIY